MLSSNHSNVGVTVAANYIEDVFSTYLYTGNGSTQTITNGIDLSTKGGLVWAKSRSNAGDYGLIDTARGSDKIIYSDLPYADTASDVITSFNSNGFTLGSGATLAVANTNTHTYASWTFREQAKFFDIVTYSGNGSNRTISHNLGSVPACIMVKRTDSGSSWAVYHRSLANTEYLVLNSTAAKATGATRWNSTTPTSTEFSLGTDATVNSSASGATYVAYLFAHDAGGFGLTGTDNVISCGSYTGTGAAGNSVTLGYEPQLLLVKRSNGAEAWLLFDIMRGMFNTGAKILYPNDLQSEDNASSAWAVPTATGFTLQNAQGSLNASGGTYIYIAIRRGPMKVPTTGTSVFAPVKKDFDGLVNSGFPTDLIFGTQLEGGNNWRWLDRLRGGNKTLSSNSTSAEATENYWKFDNNSGVVLNIGSTFSTWSWCNFLRAPSFFDVVCYTGSSSATTVTHNLAAVPELIICKNRTNNNGNQNWQVYSSALGNTSRLQLNTTDSVFTGTTVWNSTSPTSSVFSLGTSALVNGSGDTYVAYLFATCAGVSKVGSYTGTGTTKQIDCGFTGGARFVLIKRTDSTGAWYVWDTARGIVSGNDPYLLINSTAAEVTSTDYIDTYSAGFEISSTAPADINSSASGATYIFLAIA